MTITQKFREEILTAGLSLNKCGLEVSPLYRPTVKKHQHNIFYTDYCSADESRKKHASYEHDEIMDIDFVWLPGKRLSSCIEGGGVKFSYAISSHVMEHVPNPIGWLLQIFEVLEVDGVFSIALPDKRFCFDKFRDETSAADLIDSWIRMQEIPSPYQLYDFLSKSVDGSGEYGKRAFDIAACYEDAKRHYSDADAINFVFNSWVTGTYFDAHCTVYTPDSFVRVFKEIVRLGILNIEISEPIIGHEEFFVQLKKIGEPKISHPGQGYFLKKGVDFEEADLIHARKAFFDAVVIQDQLKSKILELQSEIAKNSPIKSFIKKFIKNS
jgi:hypothetical protein